ncbi:MAG: AAA family ATPase [Bacteroidia bacterium]
MNNNRQLLYESEESLIYLEEKEGKKTIRKILRSDAPEPDLVVRFNNEYEFTKDLQIPGIRKALALQKDHDHLAIVFEYIDGITLDEAFIGKDRPLTEILNAFIQIADTLGKLHLKGIIHKDINGRNILWIEKEKQPLIIDFGISNRLDLVSNNLGNPDKIKGTLTHMSPEQTGRVNRKIDSRSDLYSLGVTMYQILTGKLPFESNDSLELVHFHIAKSVPLAHLENKKVPPVISAIIAKLMAKNAEDRYQSAFGLKHDLVQCVEQLAKSEKIKEFKIGMQDFSGKFQIPQKLYGRDEEVKTLLKAFERVGKGSTELFLVAGYSGVGKSVLISELYKPITEHRGYFVGGKFDQYQRNIPYYAIIHAFTEFCQLILTEKKESLDQWRKIISESVGENGRVLTDLIPELENVIGTQPEIVKLESQEALNRFNIVFQNFIKTISKPEHPFVLFIDDLQWADVGSLNLIKSLVTDTRNPYLLVIGAYRSNEVNAGHPLLAMIDDAAKDKAVINTIELKPLLEEHLFQIIKESLLVDDDAAHQLTQIVFSKTLGNAFFTIEFLKSLNQLGLVRYNFDQRKWEVNFEAIKKKGITNNVVELLVSKIKVLPAATQNVLKLASCIGGLFDLRILSVINNKTIKETLAQLWIAVEEGLLVPVGEKYQYVDFIEDNSDYKIEMEFPHDRIQQAAYSLMNEGDHAQIHLEIGRLLLKHRDADDETIFDIVNHCNEGVKLIKSEKEKSQLAKLNLKAALQARDSSAYGSALNYVLVSKELAGDEVWKKDYPFALKLNKAAAEIEYLNGNFETSENLIHVCLEKANTPAEKSDIYFMLMQNQSNRTKYYEAIDSARQGLKLLDFVFPQKDDCPALIPAEMGKVIGYFMEHGVDSVFKKPGMSDQRLLSVMNILDNLSPPTYVTGETNMWILHVLLKVNLTIEHGLSPQGGYSFSELGIIFFIMGNYEFAYPAALMSKRIVEKFRKQSPRHLCRAGHLFTNYNTPWVKHINETFKLNPEYYQISLDSGELIYAGYTGFYPIYNSYFWGKEPLPGLLSRLPDALEFTQKIHHDLAHDSLRALQLVMSNLAGITATASDFDLPEKSGADLLAYCKEVNDGYGITMFHLYKAQAYYLYGNLADALYCLQVVAGLAGVLAGNATSHSTFNMLYSLTLIGLMDKAGEHNADQLKQIDDFQLQLKTWSDQNPSNFEHKYFLVAAEIDRLKGNTLPAIENYRKAIASADKFEFERETALIHHKAGEFWIKQGNTLYAQPHLERSRYLYEKLGYLRIVKLLEEKHQLLLSATSRFSATHEHTGTYQLKSNTDDIAEFDMLSVMKASHALSEEIKLDRLIEKMLRIVIENAGGQRAVLMLQNSGKWKVEADFNIEQNTGMHYESKDLDSVKDLPVSVINYVIRTQAEVLSDQKSINKIFDRDDYFKNRKPSSFLCLPLNYKGETNGILYVEHKTSTDTFNAERLNVLHMLTGQMAVSLENAGLYSKQFELIQAYQRFVPLDFISALGHQSILQVKLGDHIKEDMTVMFCDIRSYSSMSEGMSTEENFNFINAYLKRVGPVIQKNNGFINHYYGDGFIALFKNTPENALHAAMEIIEAIALYNKERIARGNVPIALGFGIHTGPIMMGIIGDDQRNDANVISDAVNTSSRLEGLTKIFGASILMSDKTLERIEHPELFKFRYLGRIKVKGKEDVMAVHEMFSADEAALMEKKEKTLDNFNQGLKDYFEKHFAEAALSLKKVLDENPQDKAARRYLQNAARFMVEGVLNDWDGVEQMTEK